MRTDILVLLLLLAGVSEVYSQNGQDRRNSATLEKIAIYQPNSNYRDVKLRGYTIRVNKLLMRGHAELYKQAVDVMDHQLFKIERVLSAQAIRKLQKVVIWLEYEEPHHPCAAYHPGRQWLVDNEMNPDKVKCVEISNAKNFVDWTISQPYMVLHEMAHAYHDQFLPKGFENVGVLKAFQTAMIRSGLPQCPNSDAHLVRNLEDFKRTTNKDSQSWRRASQQIYKSCRHSQVRTEKISMHTVGIFIVFK